MRDQMIEDRAAIQGTVTKLSTMADGAPRMQIDCIGVELEVVAKLCGHGQHVAIAPLTMQSGLEGTKLESEYGIEAQILYKSAFFRTPVVWAAVGSDDDFLAWVRTQPSALSGQAGTDENPVVAAHVRRIADGAGTGIKPQYAAIPLLHTEHTEQHQHGESKLADSDWWDRARINCVHGWCWETLKAKLGYESWSQIPPTSLFQWARESDVQQFLPSGYLSGGE